MPFFSIIIPTYNRANFLPKAIESVINQFFTDWELIIVDDGSTDKTRNIVEPYLTDARILYQYQHNQERCVSRNNGIKSSSGRFITFLDSDDYYLPQRLRLLYDGISRNNFKEEFYYTGICFENEAGRKERKELDNTYANMYDFIISAVIGVPQACIHHSILQNHQFDPAFTIGEDMELWLRIVGKHELIFLDNQATYIASDHIDRSVNEIKSNPGAKQLRLLKHIFKKPHPGSSVSKMVRNNKLSGTHFSIARHYMYNGKRFLAIKHLLRSIYIQPWHEQTKHRVYLILSLLLGKTTEYN